MANWMLHLRLQERQENFFRFAMGIIQEVTSTQSAVASPILHSDYPIRQGSHDHPRSYCVASIATTVPRHVVVTVSGILFEWTQLVNLL